MFLHYESVNIGTTSLRIEVNYHLKQRRQRQNDSNVENAIGRVSIDSLNSFRITEISRFLENF